MSEPGAVSGTIAQPNTQGAFSRNQYSSFVPTGGDAANPISGKIGATGFNVSGSQNADESTGAVDGENDEVEQKELGETGDSIPVAKPGRNNIPESPFVRYVKRIFSDGKQQHDQSFFSSRSLGRGMNKENIRNASYWNDNEGDLFTMDLTNPSTDEIGREEIEEITHLEHRDV